MISLPKSCWCNNENLKEYSNDYNLCPSCDTLVSNYDFSEDIYNVSDENGDLYGDNYWKEFMVDLAGVNNLDELNSMYLNHRCLYWLKYFLQYCLPGASVGEIGGGLGQFSYLLKLAGFKETMYEISPNICEYSKETFDVDVKCEYFNGGSKMFEGMVMLDLVEHILNPVELMISANDSVTNEGVVMIQTPCYDPSLNYEEMLKEKPRFNQLLDPNQHIYIFSKKSIEKLLIRSGFLHVEFLPAVFGDDYDMFMVASKVPISKNTDEQILSSLSDFKTGTFIWAAIQLLDKHSEITEKYSFSEFDRGERLKVINELSANLEISENDRQERLKIINELSPKLDISENIREELASKLNEMSTRLENLDIEKNNIINELRTKLSEANADIQSLLLDKEDFWGELTYYYEQWYKLKSEREFFERLTKPFRLTIKFIKYAIRFCLPFVVVRYIQIKKYGR